MTISFYEIGNTVRLKVSFVDNVTGNAFDPSTISVQVVAPNGVLTTYTYPATVVKDAVGSYHLDLLVNAISVWNYTWFGTAAGGNAAASGQFEATPNLA